MAERRWTTRWPGSSRAIDNAREATRELARLRLEREEVAIFLVEELEARLPEPLAAEA